MSEKASLKTMRCPTCGAPLKAENSNDAITCVYCGNTIVPVAEVTPAVQQAAVSGGFGSVVRVEGIKTASSALAYMEQFYEEYDWEAFSYAQTLSVAEIDRLADSLKAASADNKNTWFVCFKAISVPFIHKVAGCKKLLASVIEEYQSDNLDAYSMFDAYKRIAAMISASKSGIIANLEKFSAKAARYGASAEEISSLSKEIDTVKNLDIPEIYSHIENIPQIQAFIQAKNAKIVQELAAKGIQAENELARAKTLIAHKYYADALHILLTLNGYSDANALIEKIDKYFLISDVLEIEGKLYYFKKKADYGHFSLYPTAEGKVSEKAVIKNIKKIIANYADILYYLDDHNHLRMHKLSTQAEDKLCDQALDSKSIYAYGRKIFLLTAKEGIYGPPKCDVVELDLATGAVKTILNSIESIVSFAGSKIVYTVSEKIDNNHRSHESNYKTLTKIMDVDTLAITELSSKNVSVEGFMEDCVVYTQESPNDYNKDLYIKPLTAAASPKLIEKNIYKFCGIIANKLFYYIGNSKNQSLINVNSDGSQRKEWPLYISNVLFEQGGWLYFIRKVGYNSILCKARLDGSKFTVIAADIERFIELKNGYLYYINDVSTLVKVRMDGSNLQKLCEDVETVLAVKEDKIIFVSIDDKITSGVYPQVSTKIVKSIYSVDFSGSGKVKLAYNILDARKYDENTVYYITEQKIKTSSSESEENLHMLYKLDAQNNRTQFLLVMKAETPKQIGCYVATCVYGSYDCPQVWTLRRFRDDVLASTWYGRMFIRVYYAVSPTLVKWFGHTVWFKKLWQGKLDRMVGRLQEKGVENTPYEDQNW